MIITLWVSQCLPTKMHKIQMSFLDDIGSLFNLPLRMTIAALYPYFDAENVFNEIHYEYIAVLWRIDISSQSCSLHTTLYAITLVKALLQVFYAVPVVGVCQQGKS